MTEEQQGKPKIIVDDDWKTRAQAEKEQLQQQAATKKQPAEGNRPDAAPEPTDDPSLPPASFGVLLTSLATQALAMLGQVPLEDGKPVVNLAHAKHYIDTLGILEEKTRGNLTADEAAILDNLLHELRMMYVAVQRQAASTAKQQPG